MNYQFGNTFKALRKQRNLTQEQAAEFLGVSSQAISKWETNSTFPDISLLPIIADFFNVSIDYLLCHDLSKRNEEIERVCRESEALIQNKKYIDAVTLMRTAYTKFPGNDLIMYHLAWALRWSIKSADIENWEENYNEAMLIYLKILEISTNTDLRSKVTRDLVYCYYTKGDLKTGRKYAEQLPEFSVCREYVLGRCNCLEGKELSEYLQTNIKIFGKALIGCLEYFADYRIISKEDMAPYSPESANAKIALVNQILE